MKTYNKLVRDKIPQVLDEKNIKYNIRIAEDQEYLIKLQEKLQEEILEFKRTPNLDEYIDIVEVLEALAKYHGIDLKPMRLRKRMKREHKGGFDKKIILESTEE